MGANTHPEVFNRICAMKQGKLKFLIFKVTSSALIFCALTACSLYSNSPTIKTVIKDCIVPPDQSATLSGHWPTTPIPIAFKAGDFTTDEISKITAAADSWNDFFKTSKGIASVLSYGSSTGPNTTQVANTTSNGTLCAQGIIQGNQFTGMVFLYRVQQWPKNYPSSAIALTSFCTIPAKGYPRMYMAVMEFNYQSFFATGAKQPDMQSIALHEFGHLLGANHSCEGRNLAGTPNCSNPQLDPEYVIASMFPVFTFDQTGTGQVKRSLGSNDESRTNCLY